MILHCFRKEKIILVVVLIIFVITGCIPQNGNPTPAPATATATKISITTLSTPLSTAQPIATATPSPTTTSQDKPIATLPPDEALNVLLGLYSNNGDCELPCWWGITPGKTIWAEARTKLAPLGWMSGPWGKGKTTRYDFSFDVTGSSASWEYLEPHLGVADEIIVGISVNSYWVKPNFDYSLSGLLETFGLPDEIWLMIVTDTPYDPYYEIVLFYAAKGIMFNASGIIQEKNDRLAICPQEFQFDTYPPAMLLWDPSANLKYQTIAYSTMGSKITDPELFTFHQLEDLSIEFNREDFYTTYLDQEATTCISISLDKSP